MTSSLKITKSKQIIFKMTQQQQAEEFVSYLF